MLFKLPFQSLGLRQSANICRNNPRSRINVRGVSSLVLDEVKDILPSKGLTKLYLFQHRVPLSYSTVIKSYAACWGPNDSSLPKGVTGEDLVRLKNVLETHRKRTGSVLRPALKLEANLIERAAELGNNTAISLLCGKTLLTSLKADATEEEKKSDEEDKVHAIKLLNELSREHNFPLAYKIKGDIAYKYGQVSKAESLYQACIDNLPALGGSSKTSRLVDSNVTTLRVECLRNIGIIRFKEFDVEEARNCFELAVIESNNPDVGNPAQATDCHYYLGQITSESDKTKARYHFEQAARLGLKESFAPLGFLLLNYFNRPELAKEWFDLGASVGDLMAIIGQFDVAILEKDLEKASKSLDLISKTIETQEKTSQPSEELGESNNPSTPEETFERVMKSRAQAVLSVQNYKEKKLKEKKESELRIAETEEKNNETNGNHNEKQNTDKDNVNRVKPPSSRWDF